MMGMSLVIGLAVLAVLALITENHDLLGIVVVIALVALAITGIMAVL